MGPDPQPIVNGRAGTGPKVTVEAMVTMVPVVTKGTRESNLECKVPMASPEGAESPAFAAERDETTLVAGPTAARLRPRDRRRLRPTHLMWRAT
jgi:hypothetical protein